MTARQNAYQPPKVGRVLIAEDEELVGKSLRQDLIKKEFDVTWFKTYEECDKALKENDFHAVIADVFLTESNESEGLKLVKLAKDMGIPSVIMTSALDLEVARNGLNNGADYLLEKPFEVDELVRVLMDIWENPRGLISRRERGFDQHQLTEKERELCRLILKGLTNQEIADVSNTTVGTVKFYSSQIFEKFRVSNRAELFNLVFPT